MDCLALMSDGRRTVDEAYKEGSGSEHGIYQAYRLYTLPLDSRENLRSIQLRRERESRLYGGFYISTSNLPLVSMPIDSLAVQRVAVIVVCLAV